MISNVRVQNFLQIVTQEVAQQRPVIDQLDEKLFPYGEPKPKSLIEIIGTDGCGKSQLLWYIMARALLPTTYGGRNAQVIFLNTAHKFNTKQFYNQLLVMVNSSCSTTTPTQAAAIAYQRLQAVSVYKCYNLAQFTVALEEINSALLQQQNIALLVVDSLEAFYWLEAKKKPLRMVSYYSKMIAKLKQICGKHKICCAYTVNDRLLQKLSKTERKRVHIPVSYQLEVRLNKDGSRMVNQTEFSIDRQGVHLM